MESASNPHAFMGVTEHGLASIVKTRGNNNVHVILRGGTKGPNYATEHVKEASRAISSGRKARPSIMIDCSRAYLSITYSRCSPRYHDHTDGNSQKDYRNQPRVVDDIITQLAAGERAITGVMIESNINEGKQSVPQEGPEALKYGVSITDGCVNWDTTVAMLDQLHEVGPHLMMLGAI